MPRGCWMLIRNRPKTDVISAGKTWNKFVLMFMNAAHDVICYACVKRSGFVGHDVNIIFFAHKHTCFCHAEALVPKHLYGGVRDPHLHCTTPFGQAVRCKCRSQSLPCDRRKCRRERSLRVTWFVMAEWGTQRVLRKGREGGQEPSTILISSSVIIPTKALCNNNGNLRMVILFLQRF